MRILFSSHSVIKVTTAAVVTVQYTRLIHCNLKKHDDHHNITFLCLTTPLTPPEINNLFQFITPSLTTLLIYHF